MNFRTLGIIISREYLNKVKKKSFLVITFVVPVLFAALCVIPSIIMMKAKDEVKKIAVVDRSGIIMPTLEDGETLNYVDYSTFELDSVKNHISDLGYDAVLSISALDTVAHTVSADLYSAKPLGLDASENIDHAINSAVEDYRINISGIANLREIMKEVKPNISLHSYTISEDGEEKISEAGVFSVVSMLLGLMLYMFIALFSGMVMSSVIEEKSSRVVEVLISSVKATELMFGKIIGVALVAITQFLLWIILTAAIIGIVGGIVGTDILQGTDTTEIVQAAGISADQAQAVAAAVSDDSEMGTVVSSIRNLPFGMIIVSFLIFFFFGYILYATMFAAIGSAVENEADTQQLQLPVTIPLMLGFFIAFLAMKAPDNPIVFWGSMIPFTSPIVMLTRIPYGVEPWELILSIALLVGTTILFAWLSAKIYKVGILMFGKKSTWKDLMKWLKQS